MMPAFRVEQSRDADLVVLRFYDGPDFIGRLVMRPVQAEAFRKLSEVFAPPAGRAA